jgi:hypothetical protein
MEVSAQPYAVTALPPGWDPPQRGAPRTGGRVTSTARLQALEDS